MQLDQFQELVVNSPTNANLRVIGAPGSGKSRALTMRYANLYINGGIKPSRILALTFSKKASDEMKKRISETIDIDIQANNQISTINAFCYRLYNEWRKGNQMPPLKIWQYGFGTQNPIFKASELMQKYLRSSDLSVFDAINKALKSDPVPIPNLLTELGMKPKTRDMAYEMWIEYEKWMKLNNLVDFYGQVWNVDRLMHQNHVFTMMIGQKFDKILADECQDMFPQTYRILLKLAQESSIELFGDPSQSIYGFNGAAPNLFYDIEEGITDLTTHHLANNYRSERNIVEVVNDFGPQTSDRFIKMICNKSDEPGNIMMGEVDRIPDQADYIAEEINKNNYNYGDVYVLSRTNGQCSALYQRLLQLGVPANYAGNFSIWDRSYIKAGIGYLAILKGQDSPDDLGSILNIPSEDYVNAFGVSQGKYSPSRFLPRAAFSPFSFTDIANGKFKASRPQRPGINNMLKFINKLKGLDNDRQRVADIGAAISKWAQWSGKDYNQVDDDLSMLWDKMEYFDYDVNKFRIYIQKMLEAKRKIKPGSNKVEVMTIHQAKGLEAITVFLTGLSEPISGSNIASGFHPGRNTNKTINEENCLYYVGISRAIKNLYLLNYRRSGETTYQLSSFVTQLAQELAENGSI